MCIRDRVLVVGKRYLFKGKMFLLDVPQEIDADDARLLSRERNTRGLRIFNSVTEEEAQDMLDERAGIAPTDNTDSEIDPPEDLDAEEEEIEEEEHDPDEDDPPAPAPVAKKSKSKRKPVKKKVVRKKKSTKKKTVARKKKVNGNKGDVVV